MTGNAESTPAEPLFLLDESLTPAVAEALRLVGYDFRTIADELGKGTLDPDVIAWCRGNGAIWVHADKAARRKHRAILETSGIRTLWVRQPRGGISIKEQLRILTFVLPKLLEYLEMRRPPRHYRASADSPISAPSFRKDTI